MRSITSLAVLACVSLGAMHEGAAGQPLIPAGSGAYYSQPPAGAAVPSTAAGATVSPNVTASFSQLPQANKWWSSLIWLRYADNRFGFSMYPHPLAMRSYPNGLDIGYVRNPGVYGEGYGFDLNPPTTGLRMGVLGMTSPDVRVDGYGDWTVTAAWSGNGRSMKATFGHGLPFVYATVAGGDAQITFNPVPGTATVWADRGNILGVTIGPSSYAIFGPAGSDWTVNAAGATSNLNGRGYFSVAALPAATNQALDLFAAHAFAFVTDSRVSWNYNVAASTVDAQFTLTTVSKEQGQTVPLTALYRHQWLNCTQPTTTYTYQSPRGSMKLAETASFTVRYPFRGLIPSLPNVGAMSMSELSTLVDQSIASGLGGGNDTYSAGKVYGRLAQLIQLADQAGNTVARDRMLTFLKQELEEWFTIGQPGSGRSAYGTIEAESFDSATGAHAIQTLGSRVAVTGIAGGTTLQFRGVDFGASRPTRLVLNFASATTGSGLVEIRVDSPTGPVIAGGGLGSTGGVETWVEGAFGFGGTVADTLQGVHDLYLTVTTPYSGELLRLDSFRFDRAGAPADRYFAYSPTWRTLLGYPDSFGSIHELNDHHFHYGYFIMAAATVARFDPAWASPQRYGAMVNLLIADVANTSRGSTQFPFLRNFDAYAGHSQASGHAAAAAGNNQESSSESINFAAGVALWGAATGDTALRDLGAFLYASEAAAIQQYWFDADDAVFPDGLTHPLAAIVWNNGAVYATFFSGDPDLVQGINLLPVTSGSLHLGLRPEVMRRNYQHLVQATGGNPNDWQDVNWSGLAMGDPALAAQLLAARPNYAAEGGDSKARTAHWIRSLAQLGTVDAGVMADVPNYAVFTKNGLRSYIAWTPGATPLQVTFSTGFTMCVAAGQVQYAAPGTAAATCQCVGDFNQDGGVDGSDVEAFFLSWEDGSGNADVNADGGVDGQDVEYFFTRWSAGC